MPAEEYTFKAFSEHAFYRKVNQVDDFTLKLQPGVSLVGIGPLPANLRPAMDKLGSSASKILLAGSLPGSVLGSSGGGLSIRASLPPMSPSLPNGQRPPWFRSGQLAFFVEVQAGSVSAGLDGTLNVIIDDTDMSFIVGGEFGGPPIAITLSGRLVTDRPWVAPFDGKFGDLSTKWLTIREVGVALSFNPVSASLGLGFDGDIDVGSKNLEIDVALSINVVTGVPTNFIFRGVSSTPFAIDDLVTLQQQMAKAAGRSGRLPAQNIPNIEIRPVDARTPLEVKFALRSTEQVKAGFALKGALWAELKPGGPLEALAVVAADISVAGISMSGTVPRDVTIGAFDLRQPTLNIEMALLPPLASFVVNGNVELPWFTRRLGFALSRSADVSEGLQKLGAIVAAWKDFSAAFQNDPIRALENSLSGSSGLFALAGVENPPWLAELFDVVAFMRSQFPGVGSRVLLEYSLTGVDVNIPPGQGFPEGGRTPQGCLPGQTLQDGRCWTITPFAGEEMGFSPFCPTGVLEGGRCWTVPPSATWTRAKVRRRSTCRRRNRLGACVQWNYVYVCPSGTTESGGSCYGNPPGPPRLARPSTPRQVCYGVEQGGKCWKVGRAPRAGTPRGGADQICPALTPIYANNRCWTVPPRPEIQVE